MKYKTVKVVEKEVEVQLNLMVDHGWRVENIIPLGRNVDAIHEFFIIACKYIPAGQPPAQAPEPPPAKASRKK